MNERITIRLSEEAKKEVIKRCDWVSSDISHILRGFIKFVNNLPEGEAETFLMMLREFKPQRKTWEETTATLRG